MSDSLESIPTISSDDKSVEVKQPSKPRGPSVPGGARELQPLLASSSHESQMPPRDESMEVEESESKDESTASQLSSDKLSSGQMASGPSSGPSIAFQFEDSPSIKRRLKKSDSDPTSDRDPKSDSELLISISIDGQIEVEPVAGPSGLQPPVSTTPLLLPPTPDVSLAETGVVAPSTISSAPTRTTTHLSSVPSRVVKRQQPTPLPPRIEHWSDIVFTIAKYTIFLCCALHFVGMFYGLWFSNEHYQGPSFQISVSFVIEILGLASIIFGMIHGKVIFYSVALAMYLPLYVLLMKEIDIFFIWWGQAGAVLIFALFVRIITQLFCKPTDIARQYRQYRRALSAHEIFEKTEADTEANLNAAVKAEAIVEFEPCRERGESRVTFMTDSRPDSQLISPIDVSAATSQDPSRSQSRTTITIPSRPTSQAASQGDNLLIIETVAIIETAPSDDGSGVSADTPSKNSGQLNINL